KPFAKLQINPFLSELRLEYCRVTSASRTSTSKLPPTTMERLTNVFSVLDLDVEDDRPSAAASSSSSPGKEKKAVKNDKPNQQERVAPSGAYSMPLVWIDLEMTGLDVEVDRIIEIACIITDGKLTKLVEVIEFIKKHVGTYTPQIAGNSVYMDLLFIRKYMPDLASLFSHVIVDVSSVRSLCIRWYRKDHERAPAKSNKHRALDDIKESINELKYYKESIFKAKKSK
ncbi:At2g26970, partial [Linum perenne]